jgi:uncharacterized glyoxalase superfamily protein PhnB
MPANRSVPPATVIPELAYDDVLVPSEWLCRAFGFRARIRIGDHRVQLTYGEGAVIAIARGADAGDPGGTHAVLVRVEDAGAHYDQAVRAGAHVLGPPIDYPYGERQYGAVDPGGHRWTFSQSIADVDPASWGGTAVELD